MTELENGFFKVSRAARNFRECLASGASEERAALAKKRDESSMAKNFSRIPVLDDPPFSSTSGI